MNDPTPPQATPADPTASDTNAPATPSSPPAAVTAQPGTALEIAKMLHAQTIDAAQAGKLSKAGGISTTDVAQALHVLRTAADPQGPDVRSPEVKELDQHFPAAKPDEYVIRYVRPGEDATMTPELKQFDTSARTWLSGAEFPRDLGNSLVTAVARVAEQTQHMTADQLEQYGADEYQLLQRAHGDRETLEKRLVQAGEMVEALEQKTPGLKNLLKSRGIGDSALIASLLIQQSERWHARRKGR